MTRSDRSARTQARDGGGGQGPSLGLFAVAWGAVQAMPGVVRQQPFGPEYDVAKIGGRVFLMTTEVPGRPVVTVKCEPEYGRALCAECPSITPGYHMNKRHWISISDGRDVSNELVQELVLDSYFLVRDALPKAIRLTNGWLES
jgi:predicted DNA-binding protein (MmcQ/YjbR family)